MAICRCTNIYFIWHAYAMLPFHVTIIYMLDARVYIVRRRRIKNIIFETSKSCSLEGIKRKKRWNDRMKNEKSKDKKKKLATSRWHRLLFYIVTTTYLTYTTIIIILNIEKFQFLHEHMPHYTCDGWWVVPNDSKCGIPLLIVHLDTSLNRASNDDAWR